MNACLNPATQTKDTSAAARLPNPCLARINRWSRRNGTKYSHREDGIHERTAPFDRGKLGSDDRREGIITPKADAHDETPEEDDSQDGNTLAVASNSLSQCPNEYHDKFDAVHFLAAKAISEQTEEDLFDDSSRRRGELDGCLGTRGHDTSFVVRQPDHVHDEISREEVIGVCENPEPATITARIWPGLILASSSCLKASRRVSRA